MSSSPKLPVILCLHLITSSGLHAFFNEVPERPPMGWLAWEDAAPCKESCVNEELVKRNVRLMRELGFSRAGYEYIVLNNRWSNGSRNQITMSLEPDAARYPSGIITLGAFVRDNMMKIGLPWNIIDQFTQIDVRTVANWGIEFLSISTPELHEKPTLTASTETYVKEQRKHSWSIFILCESNLSLEHFETHPHYVSWARLIRACNGWNISFADPSRVDRTLEFMWRHVGLIHGIVGPGYWNYFGPVLTRADADNIEEMRTRMAVWCLFASPLFVSTDLSQLSRPILRILLNPRLIRINQDKGSRTPVFIKIVNRTFVWSRELFSQPNTWSIAFLNRDKEGVDVDFTLVQLGIRRTSHFSIKYTLTDVFTGDSLAPLELTKVVTFTLGPHETLMYHVQPYSLY